MGAETFVLKHIADGERLVFEYPSSAYKQKLMQILDVCGKKTNDYVTVTVNRPYKRRTQGEKSQNNLFYKLVTIIAQETGNEIEDVKDGAKERAVARGYPYRINPLTNKLKPFSSANVNTVQMSYLIDACYEIIAELGVILPPTEDFRNVAPQEFQENTDTIADVKRMAEMAIF